MSAAEILEKATPDDRLYAVKVQVILKGEGRIPAWDKVAELVRPLREHEDVVQVTLEDLRAREVVDRGDPF